MKVFFLIILSLYVIIFIYRIILSYYYIKKKNNPLEEDFNEEQYTIIQPILSGDPLLSYELEKNLQNTGKLKFFWLLDKEDLEADKICRKILEKSDYNNRVRIFYFDKSPQGVNPKIYKIKQVIAEVLTDYIIVLDDDSVIDFGKMPELNIYKNFSEEIIISGIPYNYGNKSFWSKLVAAFVNSNSYISYLTLAYLGANKSINGMFYIISNKIVNKYNLFENIETYLCDDLAVADYLSQKGVKIIQSTISVNVRTSVNSFLSYIRLMKRWLVFSRIYFKKHFSLPLLLLVIIPNFLSFFLIYISLYLGIKEVLLVLLTLITKSIVLYMYRFLIIHKKQGLYMIFYELLNDIIIFPIFIYSILSGRRILWRDKWIRIEDGKINYED